MVSRARLREWFWGYGLLVVNLWRPKAAFIKTRRGRLPPPRILGLARGAYKTAALFTMLIGAHVKHKFMLKAEMLSSSRMRYGADRSYLPVSDDQTLARYFETHDNVDATFFLPRSFVSSRICCSFPSRASSFIFVPWCANFKMHEVVISSYCKK